LIDIMRNSTGRMIHHRPIVRFALAAMAVCAALAGPSSKSRALAAEAVPELSAQEIFKRVSPSVMVVESLDARGNVTAFGSGVVIAPCRVITNRHVIEDGASFKLEQRGMKWPAQLVRVDADHDLAELSVASLAASPVQVRESSALVVGEKVYAIGAPEGLELTISEGLVSGLRQFDGQLVIQTSAAISPGSSGGGLFDRDGLLVGITTAFLEEGQSLNFALPAELATELNKFGTLADGEFTGAYSGIAQNLTAGKTADIAIVVTQKGSSIQGCLAVSLPLYGSGPLHGTVRGSEVSFDVSSPLFLLKFRGHRGAANVVGTYLAEPTVWAVQLGAPGAVQEGKFRLYRESLKGVTGTSDSRNCPDDTQVHAN
jgi:S1-C subfamily serine protease